MQQGEPMTSYIHSMPKTFTLNNHKLFHLPTQYLVIWIDISIRLYTNLMQSDV